MNSIKRRTFLKSGVAASAQHALAAVYSVLCAPEPQAKLEELLPSLQMTIEGWLWHRLCMVRVQLLEAAAAAGPALRATESQSRALTKAASTPLS